MPKTAFLNNNYEPLSWINDKDNIEEVVKLVVTDNHDIFCEQCNKLISEGYVLRGYMSSNTAYRYVQVLVKQKRKEI